MLFPFKNSYTSIYIFLINSVTLHVEREINATFTTKFIINDFCDLKKKKKVKFHK